MSTPGKQKKPGAIKTVQEIAERLRETKPGPLTLIRRIVKAIGPEESLRYLRRTLEIEEQGGMQNPAGKRRTPGGVFFHLIKVELPKETTYPIFWLKPYIQRTETRTTPAPRPQPLLWSEREQALAQRKERSNVSATIQLRGRVAPESIIDTGSCIICTLYNTKGPNVPKGVPAPPAEDSTKYDVYVSYKLWRKVATAATDEEDNLIIDGYPRLDAQQGSIAVIATNTSSKKLKMAEKAPKPEE